MTKALTLCLVIVGLINFLPVIGVLGAQRLESAYGVALSSNDLVILMRHRALLFGILGGFVLYAAFLPAYQWAAMVLAGISMLGFALLAWTVGGYNASLHKVLLVDLAGLAVLAVAVALKLLSRGA